MRARSNEDGTSASQDFLVVGDLQLPEALVTVRYCKVTEHWGAVLIGQDGMVSAFGDADAEGVHGTLLAKRGMTIPTIG